MNIEIANRLVNLRKKSGLSQEDLAGRLGISRQAVSKWERAEASPDTDNLIALAKLYGVSLDELLLTAAEEPARAEEPEKKEPPVQSSPFVSPNFPEAPAYPEPPVAFGETEAQIPFDDAYKTGKYESPGYEPAQNYAPPEYASPYYEQPAAAPPPTVTPDSVDCRGDHCQSQHSEYQGPSGPLAACYPILMVILFLFLGFFFHLWHPAWMLFLTIPLYYTLPRRGGSWLAFPYPVLVVILFLVLGFFWGLWHPAWLLFLTIPLYYIFSASREHGQ